MRRMVHFWHYFYVFTFTNTHSDILKRKTDTNLPFQSHCTLPSSHDPPLDENKCLKHGSMCCTTKTELRHRYPEKKTTKTQHLSIPQQPRRISYFVSLDERQMFSFHVTIVCSKIKYH